VTVPVSPKYSVTSCQDFGLNVVNFILISFRICSLSVFAKLRKASVSFIIFVCPSAWYNSVPFGCIFLKFYIWVLSENLSWKLSSIKMWEEWLLYMMTYVLIILYRWILLRMRSVSKKLQRMSNKGFMFNNFFFRKYFFTWDNVTNMVQPDRPQMTVK
jgi:hypothetical protein